MKSGSLRKPILHSIFWEKGGGGGLWNSILFCLQMNKLRLIDTDEFLVEF